MRTPVPKCREMKRTRVGVTSQLEASTLQYGVVRVLGAHPGALRTVMGDGDLGEAPHDNWEGACCSQSVSTPA